MTCVLAAKARPIYAFTISHTPIARPRLLLVSCAQIAGLAMAPVALAFMLYALYMYRKRSAQILRRETVRFDDQRGPVVLTCMLITVLIVAYVLTLRAAIG